MASKTPDDVPDFTPRTTVLTKDNLLVSGSVVVSAIAITIMVMGKLNSIENRIGAMEWRIKQNWTLPQQRQQNYEMQRENPAIKVPDADVIASKIQ